MKPDIVHLKTRWFFMTRDHEGYAVEGAVEFEDDREGQRCARVYSRRDFTNARIAFQAYASELIAARKRKPTGS